MIDTAHITVGIEPRIMAGHMTGIGNYTLNLLQALVQDFPEVTYRSYNRLSWVPTDGESLARIADRHGKGNVPGSSLQASLSTKLRRDVRSRLSRNAIAKSVHAKLLLNAYRYHFRRTVGRQNLDLFHAFNFVPLADPGVPVLPVVYDLSFVRYPDAHPAARLKNLEPLPKILDRARLIQTISEFSKHEICSVYGIHPDRIFVAPPAASSSFVRLGTAVTAPHLAQYDLTSERYFLAVGTLEPRKNLRTLIEAFSCLTAKQRQAHPLVIVGGTGWGDIDLPRASSAMMADGSLRFVGAVSDDQLRSLYEGARALLFPSIYEGFGMPVVEAFSCGTQVVHGIGTSMSEITGDLAVQVTAQNNDDWLNAMTQLLDQTDAQRTSLQHERIDRADTFSWHRSAGLVRDAYRQYVAA